MTLSKNVFSEKHLLKIQHSKPNSFGKMIYFICIERNVIYLAYNTVADIFISNE